MTFLQFAQLVTGRAITLKKERGWDVFVEYSPHVEMLSVSVMKQGWVEGMSVADWPHIERAMRSNWRSNRRNIYRALL